MLGVLVLATLVSAQQRRGTATDAAGTCRTDPCPCTERQKARGKVDTAAGCRCPTGHTETKEGKCFDCSNLAKRIAELEAQRSELISRRQQLSLQEIPIATSEARGAQKKIEGQDGSFGNFHNTVGELEARKDALGTLIESLEAIRTASDASGQGRVGDTARKVVDGQPAEHYSARGSQYARDYTEYQEAAAKLKALQDELKKVNSDLRAIDQQIKELRAACRGTGDGTGSTAPRTNAGGSSGSGGGAGGGGGGGGGGSSSRGGGGPDGGERRHDRGRDRAGPVGVLTHEVLRAGEQLDTRLREAAVALGPFIDGTWAGRDQTERAAVAATALTQAKALRDDYARAIATGQTALASYCGVRRVPGCAKLPK